MGNQSHVFGDRTLRVQVEEYYAGKMVSRLTSTAQKAVAVKDSLPVSESPVWLVYWTFH
jgi:hypothetical protein